MKINANITIAEFDNQALIQMPDGSVNVLNETAFEILKEIENNNDIYEKMYLKYHDVDKNIIKEDIDQLIKEMIEKEIIYNE